MIRIEKTNNGLKAISNDKPEKRMLCDWMLACYKFKELLGVTTCEDCPFDYDANDNEFTEQEATEYINNYFQDFFKKAIDNNKNK